MFFNEDSSISLKGSGILGKKCSLSVAACDITIDMAANGNGTGKRDSAATIDSNMLSKKSPMHKLARLARLAGTSIGRDAMNNSSGRVPQVSNIHPILTQHILFMNDYL